MKGLAYTGLIAATITMALSIVTKYLSSMGHAKGYIAGVGPGGYLNATVVLLLFSANLALIELLNKKQ